MRSKVAHSVALSLALSLSLSKSESSAAMWPICKIDCPGRIVHEASVVSTTALPPANYDLRYADAEGI
jgi:hypothetical protein